jgi:hypothetical protein
MCLKVLKSVSKKFVNCRFTAYKVFQRIGVDSDRVTSLNFHDYDDDFNPFQAEITKDGAYVSNRKTKTRTHYEKRNGVINKGIHVYLNKKDAEADKIYSRLYILIPVVCYKKDLIDFGYHASSWDCRGIKQAVFMKVKIKHKCHRKLFKTKW